MLNLNRLRLIRELSVLGSMSAVARSMKLTRPAVSQQIALLEKEIGEVFLERSASGVSFTNAGERLVKRAAEIFTLVEQLEAELEGSSEVVSGEVRVSALGSLATGLVPQAFKRLRATHPMISLIFTEHDSVGGLRGVVEREADIAIVDEWAEITRPARNLEFVHLGEDRFKLVVAANHPLAKRKTVHLQELASDLWVLNQASPSARSNLLQACQSVGFLPREVCNCHTFTAAIEFVRAINLVTVFPDRGLEPYKRVPGVRFIELNPPIRRRIRAAVLPHALSRLAVHATLQALRQAAEK